MKTFILSLLGSLFLIPSSYAEPEIKGSASELALFLSNVPRGVTLSGEGEVKAQADRAVVLLKITTEHKSLAEALQANDQIRSRLAAFLQNQGIGSDRIHASKFSSTPKYSYFSEKVKLHRVENQIEITVQNEKELQAVGGRAG